MPEVGLDRALMAKAVGVKVVELPLREILELAHKIAGVIDGNGVALVNTALLSNYYLAAQPLEAPVDIDEMVHFMDEGSFLLASLIKALQENRGKAKAGVKGN